jgi:hypothetical protein
MKLLTRSIQSALPKFYSTESVPLNDKIVICKFFTPWTYWSWFVFEGKFELESNDWLFFGMVHGFEKETGYFRLSELEEIRGPSGLTIERDLNFFKVPYVRCCR